MNKIEAVIMMVEKGNYQRGYKKLGNDIAPKLADPRPTPRTSRLYTYPEDSPEQRPVTSFAMHTYIGFIFSLARKRTSKKINRLGFYVFFT